MELSTGVLTTNLLSFVQIGAGKGRIFYVGVIGVAVTALAVGPRGILEVKNACVLRYGVHHLQSFSFKCLPFDTMKGADLKQQ
jgi:hypothetical protein